jgi:hypothetical protein
MARDLKPVLSRLPADIAAKLAEAVALLRRADHQKPEASRKARDASGVLVAQAFAAAGFPKAEPVENTARSRPVLASELTAPQRVMVEVYADIEDALIAEVEDTPTLFDKRIPIPIRPETMRRWLGITPPTVLEEELEWKGQRWPLWRHACEGGFRNGASMRALVDSLPIERALPVIDALSHWSGYGFEDVPNLYRSSRPIREMKGEGVAWARAEIEKIVAATSGPPRLFRGVPQPQFEHDTALLALVAMARAGVPIEPEWDPFLVCSFEFDPPPFVEAAMAIPEARRHAAAAAAVRGWGQNDTKVAKALALLKRFDSVEVARAVFELLPRTIRAKQTVQELAAMSKTKPGIARALAEHLGKLPRPVPLTVRERVHPVDAGKLSPSHAAQLAAAKKGDPDNFDEPELVDDLELRVLHDASGKHVYDTWLYATDTGVYYAAGTTKKIAHRIQGGIEALGKTSPSVLAGLDAMSDRRGAPSNMAVRPDAPSKKAPAKKGAPAKKKAPAKKAPAKKKPPAKKSPAKKPPSKKR